jgi:hypothetical protein
MEDEGRLFSEFNELGKKPSNAASIDMYATRTPSTRFVEALMNASSIFARPEIETRFNTIGSKSRKLTTNATMASAIKPFSKQLFELEKTPKVYADLIAFFVEFYNEQPTTVRSCRKHRRRCGTRCATPPLRFLTLSFSRCSA